MDIGSKLLSDEYITLISNILGILNLCNIRYMQWIQPIHVFVDATQKNDESPNL